jgi:hypothetical protein
VWPKADHPNSSIYFVIPSCFSVLQLFLLTWTGFPWWKLVVCGAAIRFHQ